MACLTCWPPGSSDLPWWSGGWGGGAVLHACLRWSPAESWGGPCPSGGSAPRWLSTRDVGRGSAGPLAAAAGAEAAADPDREQLPGRLQDFREETRKGPVPRAHFRVTAALDAGVFNPTNGSTHIGAVLGPLPGNYLNGTVSRVMLQKSETQVDPRLQEAC